MSALRGARESPDANAINVTTGPSKPTAESATHWPCGVTLRETRPMLNTAQQERILRQAGIAVPEHPCPVQPMRMAQQQGVLSGALDEASEQASARWTRTIDTLFVQFNAERAARSLRVFEEARRFEALRHASARRAR
jgi:hypothetical protein